MGDRGGSGIALGSGEVRDLGNSFEIDGVPAKPQDQEFIPAFQKPEPKQSTKGFPETLRDKIAEKVGKVIEEKLEEYIDKLVEELDEKLEELLQ